MKKALIAFTSIVLFSSPALSQGMRDTLNNYNASERCFRSKDWNEKHPEYCLYGNGNIHSCYWTNGSCWEGVIYGKLNQRFRETIPNLSARLYEYYLEKGNLVRYKCFEGNYMQCDSRPEKDVYYPF